MNINGIRNHSDQQAFLIRAQERRLQAQEERQAREAELAKLASEADEEAKQALDPNTVPKQRPADRDRYEPDGANQRDKTDKSDKTDQPEKADKSDKTDKPEKADKSEKKAKTERCVGNTDQVDREIEKLKKKKEQLKQQINTCEDPEKAEKLKKELALVENELRQKDNDGYRRSHTVFSNI